MSRLGFLVTTAAVLVVTSAAAHDHWINVGRYRSPQDGSLCCGESDCVLVPEAGVRVSPGGYTLPSGETIPFAEALVSEDGQFWRCKRPDGTRRCFFAPRGGT
jgi:hypothetical protein